MYLIQIWNNLSQKFSITIRLQIGYNDFSDVPWEKVLSQLFREFPKVKIVFLPSNRLSLVDQ